MSGLWDTDMGFLGKKAGKVCWDHTMGTFKYNIQNLSFIVQIMYITLEAKTVGRG